MPDVEIVIGGRTFDVACQKGEEHSLHAAAKVLDREISALTAQFGRIPETRMLLMAGLMLADKTMDLQNKIREAGDRAAEKEAELDRLRNAPAPEAGKIEGSAAPKSVLDSLAKIAMLAESLAEQVDASTSDRKSDGQS